MEFMDGVRLERKVNLDHGALEKNESGDGLDDIVTHGMEVPQGRK